MNAQPVRHASAGALQTAIRHLCTGLLALFLIHVFLSQWSLLDGSPRNSLGVYLQSEAEKPFAYRWLAPVAVKHLVALMPEGPKALLADHAAPLFYQVFADPWLQKCAPQLPGLMASARADWDAPDYRTSYVLMAGLLWLASAASLSLIGKMALALGTTRLQAALLVLAYALIYPSVFLHAGYFYDVFEQCFALLAIHCVLRQRWLAFAMVLTAMQCNRETAIMLPVFLAPLIHTKLRSSEKPGTALAWLALAMAACLAIYQCTRLFFADNPGASAEFHLFQNLAFWREPGTWTATYDIYAQGIPLPRLLFLLCIVPMLIVSLMGRRGPMAWSGCLCMAIMSLLFIAVGYRDEFRAMGICLPFVLLALAGRLGQRNTALAALEDIKEPMRAVQF